MKHLRPIVPFAFLAATLVACSGAEPAATADAGAAATPTADAVGADGGSAPGAPDVAGTSHDAGGTNADAHTTGVSDADGPPDAVAPLDGETDTRTDPLDSNGTDTAGDIAPPVQDVVPDTADPSGDDAGDSDAGDPAPGQTGVTVLSLNLHCLKTEGTPYADNDARFAAIAERVADEGVDVLLLQEACEIPALSAMTELRTRLEAATGIPWHDAWAKAHVAWEGTPDEADEGLGLLARSPLQSEETLVYAVQGGLQRVALSATVAPPAGTLRVTSVHLDYGSADTRLAQARETANAALVDAAPSLDALIGGDFNSTAGSAPHQALAQWGFLDQSADLDPKRIDHVFVHRGAPWRASEAHLVFDTPDSAVSDHPGVLVRLLPHPGDAPVVTQLEITADVGFGHFLSVRGGSAPLSWEAGWPARSVAADTWRLVCTELTGSFAYKSLTDDAVWQAGEDEAGGAGQTNTSEPEFP